MAITAKEFEQMQARLRGAKRKSASVGEPSLAVNSSAQDQIIIGVDPSLRGTGYGVIHACKPSPRALAHGTIKCPAEWEHSRCLAHISRTLRDVIAQHRPTICAIEGLFFAQNLQTALTMGEARGASLAALGEAGIEIYEIAPRKIKQAIVGFGGAQKLAVSKMVQRLLQLPEPPAPDAADALAVALAHLQTFRHSAIAAPKRI